MSFPVSGEQPLVSVVMATHERPHLLPVALRCYREQTYSNRELIVVDDGQRFPAREADVVAAGGRLLRVSPGMPLGAKLNLGLEQAAGEVCLKMDDDDYYAPDFMAHMISLWQQWRAVTDQPNVACLVSYPFFDVLRWRLHRSGEWQIGGGALLFSRVLWRQLPFRPVVREEDYHFLTDHQKAGARWRRVPGRELYVCVRHSGHLWLEESPGTSVEQHVLSMPLHPEPPEAVFPDWALAVYRVLHSELVTVSHGSATSYNWLD